MAAPLQQPTAKAPEKTAYLQKLRNDLRKLQASLHKHAKHQIEHEKHVTDVRQSRREEQEESWLLNIARLARIFQGDGKQKRKKSPLEPGASIFPDETELFEAAPRRTPLSSTERAHAGAASLQPQRKLTREERRSRRVSFFQAQKQELRSADLSERKRIRQALRSYRVSASEGRPNLQTLRESGTSLQDIRQIFESYIVSFFQDLSLSARYLSRAYAQWIQGGHAAVGRPPTGLLGQIIAQMEFARSKGK